MCGKLLDVMNIIGEEMLISFVVVVIIVVVIVVVSVSSYYQKRESSVLRSKRTYEHDDGYQSQKRRRRAPRRRLGMVRTAARTTPLYNCAIHVMYRTLYVHVIIVLTLLLFSCMV